MAGEISRLLIIYSGSQGVGWIRGETDCMQEPR